MRELALRQVAEQVDRSLASYMEEKDIQETWAVRERIAVCISSNPRAQYLLARAARMARRMDAELYAVHVDIGKNGERARREGAGGEFAVCRKPGREDGAAEGQQRGRRSGALRERKAHHADDLRPVRGGRIHKILYMNAINRFLRDAPAVDVHIVTQEPD